MAYDAHPPSGGEGLQLLCTKYSSLISRLRDEVLARQKAEADLRLLQRRLRDEVSLREAEERKWKEQRRWETEPVQAAKPPPAFCAAGSSDLLLKQGEELSRLRREHTELGVKHREASDELAACREHLAKLRKTNADLESKLDTVQQGQEEANTRVRRLQEEARQALRSASVAKARQVSAASMAGRNERELRSREARLDSVRREGRRLAQRAASAERQLAKAEGFEATAQALTQANKELSIRLHAEIQARDAARSEAAHAEACEALAKTAASEARSELEAYNSLGRERSEAVLHLEAKVTTLQAELHRCDDERAHSFSLADKLRMELQTVREECEDLRKQRDNFAGDSTDKARRLDRSGMQFAECKKRLAASEEALSRAQSEVQEERKSREKCHLEAMKASERLRSSRLQCTHLRSRVRAMEAADLRYPSRFVAKAEEPIAALPPLSTDMLLSDEDMDVTFEPLPSSDAPKVTEPTARSGLRNAYSDDHYSPRRGHPQFGGVPSSTPPRLASPGPQGDSFAEPRATRSGPPYQGSTVPLSSPDMKALWNFVEKEDERLAGVAAPSGGSAASHSVTASMEEPRRLQPTPFGCPSTTAQGTSPSGALAAAPATAEARVIREPIASQCSDSMDLTALLAAKPRVLQLPSSRSARDFSG
mmetsp:Transcript_38352/g.90141  ORF Transcript_38352/g.90141 Transcript_38352/m.90141 type:complete len:655 (+) Transcript_38352:129-2093(+)